MHDFFIFTAGAIISASISWIFYSHLIKKATIRNKLIGEYFKESNSLWDSLAKLCIWWVKEPDLEQKKIIGENIESQIDKIVKFEESKLFKN